MESQLINTASVNEPLVETPLARAIAEILALKDDERYLNLSHTGLTSADLETILANEELYKKFVNLTKLNLSNNLIAEIPEKMRMSKI